MGKHYTRKTVAYDQDNMRKAVDLVQKGKMGYKKAAKLYALKWGTVRDQVKNRYKKMGAGRPPVLTLNEEKEIVECLMLLSHWGFGISINEILEVVGDYAKTLKRPFPFVGGVPGRDWLDGFMERHPELKKRLPEQMKVQRAKASANKYVINNWFQLVKEMLEENNLIGSPDRVYNVDERGFPLDPSRLTSIAQQGIQHLYREIGGYGWENITVMGCARADGAMLPPYVIYAAQDLRTNWTEGGPKDTKYNVSGKGWMDTACFNDWFKTQFIPFLPPPRPVVLIYDGYSSHLHPSTILEAVKNKVIILKLPPNTTHFLQPLEVSVYGPLKTEWERILIRFAQQNLETTVTKEIFPSLLNKLWETPAISADNIKAGFQRCGIMPWDPTQIPESVYASAELFDQLNPEPLIDAPNHTSGLPQLSTPSTSAITQDQSPTSLPSSASTQPSTSFAHQST